MRKISYAGYRFPPDVIHQAIWLYLWTVPAMQGLLRQSANARLQLSIRSLTQRRCWPWWDTRTGAQLFWRALEPDRASGISQFRSDRFAIMRPFALAQPRLWVAQLLGGPSIGLLCRHDRPCDTSGLVCQGDGGNVEMPPTQKPGEPGALHLTAPHASHDRPSAMNE